mmetsp:Transcript_85688/g.227671  ORF Transcript_85688/g.227671 Transcript_85688/m.227671 type:complete len:210 (-) Transcript_85688:28-657(-)
MVLLDLHTRISRHNVLVQVRPHKSVVLPLQTDHLEVEGGLRKFTGDVLLRQLLYALQPDVDRDGGLVKAAQVQAKGCDLRPRPDRLHHHCHRLVLWSLCGLGRRGARSGLPGRAGAGRGSRRGNGSRAGACGVLGAAQLRLQHVQHPLQLLADVCPCRAAEHVGELLAVRLQLGGVCCAVDLHRHQRELAGSATGPSVQWGVALILQNS